MVDCLETPEKEASIVWSMAGGAQVNIFHLAADTQGNARQKQAYQRLARTKSGRVLWSRDAVT